MICYIKMKNYYKILTERQQKYQHYHQIKLINMNILQVKKILPFNQRQIKDKLSLLILLLKNKQKTGWCYKVPRPF